MDTSVLGRARLVTLGGDAVGAWAEVDSAAIAVVNTVERATTLVLFPG